ncbi:YihY/virulence factor BrkB family protein [Aurantimonas sp. C2-6-R+9]|uniref:YihY/virulence factor BrkB family protein n=2 Tax=Aurantimonas TaxID=182269 RepID=UPI002E18F79E|nr:MULTISPECIES: YihY/virulence factor BrkB family protein [unclassified Aurantimonas]MEC5293579.1 YihY/virulence factor BrkB family protein [Aurantimonas sp. C2-3-R2]MEC5383773.1 YihY/virulence factor BrkB family protein [Aurantimonas sp. C2-6-R+9]MEC5414648.1 YihY/virulence factor BrkB family protein [Aurantimonas sp. C2-4-R8]
MDLKAKQEAARDERKSKGVLSEHPEDLLYGTGWRALWAVFREAVLRLWSDDAMGLAGNVAFRTVMAVFPFLIFASSLTAFIGDRDMADGLISFLIAIVPPALIEPLVSEVRNILTVQRGGVLSAGVLLTLWFAVGGIDGVRVGLNRAYGIREHRSTIVLYALQALTVVLTGLVLVLVGYLLVLAPRAGSFLHRLLPGFDPTSVTSGAIRYPATAAILVTALFVAHIFLPARRTRFSSIYPGVLFTVGAWIVLSAVFSLYLTRFANYASYYAGLAGIMAALYFLYFGALVLIFGGELNRAIRIRRLARAVRRQPRSESRAKSNARSGMAPSGGERRTES